MGISGLKKSFPGGFGRFRIQGHAGFAIQKLSFTITTALRKCKALSLPSKTKDTMLSFKLQRQTVVALVGLTFLCILPSVAAFDVRTSASTPSSEESELTESD